MRLEGFAARELFEGGAELGFYGGSVEVAGDGDDHIVWNDGAVVPGLQILQGDGIDGRVFGLLRVGIGFAVGQLDGDAGCDSAGVVVAAGDACFHLALGEL